MGRDHLVMSIPRRQREREAKKKREIKKRNDICVQYTT